jgi:hypothetical protein
MLKVKLESSLQPPSGPDLIENRGHRGRTGGVYTLAPLTT